MVFYYLSLVVESEGLIREEIMVIVSIDFYYLNSGLWMSGFSFILRSLLERENFRYFFIIIVLEFVF